jgi:hypothetical protein
MEKRPMSWRWMYLLLLIFLGTAVGCGPIELDFGKQKEEEGPPPPDPAEMAAKRKAQAELEARRAKLKEIATERLAAAKEKAPKFDPEPETARLLFEHFEIDVDTLPEPLLSRAAVDKKLRAQIIEDAEVEFSEERRATVIAEAEKKFPLFEIGQVVQVTTRRGGARDKLLYVGADSIKVGTHSILLRDIIEPDPKSFFKKDTDRRRRHYVNVQYNTPRGKFIGRRDSELRPQLYREHGFAPVVDNKGRERWLRVDEIIERLITPQLAELEEAFYAEQDAELQAQITQEMAAEGLTWE